MGWRLTTICKVLTKGKARSQREGAWATRVDPVSSAVLLSRRRPGKAARPPMLLLSRFVGQPSRSGVPDRRSNTKPRAAKCIFCHRPPLQEMSPLAVPKGLGGRGSGGGAVSDWVVELLPGCCDVRPPVFGEISQRAELIRNAWSNSSSIGVSDGSLQVLAQRRSQIRRRQIAIAMRAPSGSGHASSTTPSFDQVLRRQLRTLPLLQAHACGPFHKIARNTLAGLMTE